MTHGTVYLVVRTDESRAMRYWLGSMTRAGLPLSTRHRHHAACWNSPADAYRAASRCEDLENWRVIGYTTQEVMHA